MSFNSRITFSCAAGHSSLPWAIEFLAMRLKSLIILAIDSKSWRRRRKQSTSCGGTVSPLASTVAAGIAFPVCYSLGYTACPRVTMMVVVVPFEAASTVRPIAQFVDVAARNSPSVP